MKARHTTDAIPQRASAGIISEGNGGLKWRTNFSKTSSERNVHALRLFFSSSLPPLFFLFFFFPHSPSPFFLPLCFVSDMKPLFYQINISQNKSQDNFKLVREAEGGAGEREFWSSFFTPSLKWSFCLSSCSTHFQLLWFRRLRLVVGSN